MDFEKALNDALDIDSLHCPECDFNIAIFPSKVPECGKCGWKQQIAPPSGNFEFAARYSEQARMHPWRSFPGINAGRIQ